MPILKYINIEDRDGQCLRIRFADLKMAGYCAFDKTIYAIPVITEEEEKELWKACLVVVKKKYADSNGDIDLTKQFQTELRQQFDSGVAVLEFDLDAGEITIKENVKPCPTQSTGVDTSTPLNSSKPQISKKAKPKSQSKPLKK